MAEDLDTSDCDTAFNGGSGPVQANPTACLLYFYIKQSDMDLLTERLERKGFSAYYQICNYFEETIEYYSTKNVFQKVTSIVR